VPYEREVLEVRENQEEGECAPVSSWRTKPESLGDVASKRRSCNQQHEDGS